MNARRIASGLTLLLFLHTLIVKLARAQSTGVTIAPGSQTVLAPTVSVTVKWCSFPPTYFNINTHKITINGVDHTADFDLVHDPIACGFTGNESDEVLYTSTGTVSMPAGSSQSVYAEIRDFQNVVYATSVIYSTPPKRRRPRVTAAGQFVEVRPSISVQARFDVRNDGNDADTFNLAVQACTGLAITGGCSLSPNQLTLTTGQTGSATVSFTASGTANTNGLVTLRAVSAADVTARDSSWTDVTVRAAPGSNVVIVGASPGVNNFYDRSLCLTVAVADDAAMECGDLRLVYPLPSVRTLGRSRTPTLLYNSQHARPKPIIQADVTLPTSWGVMPGSVTACIMISGVARGCRTYNGPDWTTLGQTRRISVPGDDGTWNTGLYAYTLQVTDNQHPALTATGEFAVVNRQSSRFGAGWWLAGLEELVLLPDGRKMVIGGDGTVRIYTVASGNTYVANNPTRRDTLVLVGSEYIRRAENGLEVHFNATSLRHVSTRNRLGYTTTFEYLGSTLKSINIPTLGGPLRYDFNSSSTYLEAQAPTAAGVGLRNTRIYYRSTCCPARVDSIVFGIGTPTLERVRFTHGTGLETYRIASHTDRRGKVTSFAYDSTSRLSQVTRPLSIVTSVAPAESRGFSRAQPFDSAFTRVDGPRTDVADVARFWVNGYGAPTRIRNALGQETLVRYSSPWPALADSVVAANRLVSRVWYGSTRGLIDSSRVYNPFGNGDSATTRYRWHASWRFVVSIRSPLGVLDTFAYDANGNRSFESHGGITTNYTYDPTTKLMTSVADAAGADQFAYSALGNLRKTTSANGFLTLYFADQLGRDTLVISPRGTAAEATDSTQMRTHGVRTYTRYDRLDRDTLTSSIGPAVTSPYGSFDSLRVVVRKAYDLEGNMLSAQRGHAIGNAALTWLNAETWVYDDAGRVTQHVGPAAGTATYTLDPAGNATGVLTPRGLTITTDFDALNRARRRILPAVNYAQGGVFPLRDGPGLCIGVDTAYFDYDAAGNLRLADNDWALVRRSYTPVGALRRDTLTIRTYDTQAPNACGGADRHGGGFAPGDFSIHVYELRSTYNLDGRRTVLNHPSGVTQYWYNTTSGLLDSLHGPLGHTTRLGFDFAGRLTAITHPGNLGETRQYDGDSRLTSRTVGSIEGEVLTLDASGRVTFAATSPNPVTMAYNGLGALVHMDGHTTDNLQEDFDVDALGNRRWTWDSGLNPAWAPRKRDLTYGQAGQFSSATLGSCPQGQACPPWYHFSQSLNYDQSGNASNSSVTQTEGQFPSNVDVQDQTASYYGADEKLMVFDRYRLGTDPALLVGSVHEEYRYDALGRRVLVRSRQVSPCTQPPGYTYQCGSYIERIVWDGDQALIEFRARGRDSVSFGDLENDNAQGPYGGSFEGSALGRVTYVHAGGIDQPVQLIRQNDANFGGGGVAFVVPHTNWQGDYTLGSDAAGTLCQPGYNCPFAPWPGNNESADGVPSHDPPGVPGSWMGDLITSKTDGSGLHYMRNRYYDPRTGQFTQQDPIGLAGGLNAYGFGSGNPVSFSDPFGLKVCFSGDVQKAREALEAATGTAINTTGNCVSTFVVRDSSIGLRNLQLRLTVLVDDDSTYTLHYGRVRDRSGYQSRRADIDPRDLVSRFYSYRSSGTGCDRRFLASYDAGAIAAHELLGHALYSDQLRAIRVENLYHAARTQPLRCENDH